jgi:hypothetical protein
VRRKVGANLITWGLRAAIIIASVKVFMGESMTASIMSSIIARPVSQNLCQPATSSGAMSITHAVVSSMSVGIENLRPSSQMNE